MDEDATRNEHRLRRRAVLKGMGVVGGTGALGMLPKFTNARAIETEGRDYVEACGTLVGVPGRSLEPLNQPAKLATGFLLLTEAAVIDGTAMMAKWLGTYRQGTESGATSDEIARLLHDDNPTLSRLGMKLWLFGMWTGANERDDLVDLEFEGNSVKDTFVYSSLAYRRGWIWRIAQAHPMGYSHFDLNSWGADAPALTDYIGNGTG